MGMPSSPLLKVVSGISLHPYHTAADTLFIVGLLLGAYLLTGFFCAKKAHSSHPKNPLATASFK
jgi:hypothetical protein